MILGAFAPLRQRFLTFVRNDKKEDWAAFAVLRLIFFTYLYSFQNKKLSVVESF